MTIANQEQASLSHILHSRSSEPSESFCAHDVDACPFCGGRIATGHDDAGNVKLVHAAPVCAFFMFCLDAEQFAMFARLKVRSDAGNRERN